MGVILKAENISKQYRLGVVGTGTLREDLNRWWHRLRGKNDPYLKVGGVNDRSVAASEDYVWALRDINFEVRSGEVLGIIGKNGAGKSTLLKVLSRITSPTTGTIKTKGRIASLLEVGTGFHGELTGRENIFMNGAVLGMTKNEIKNKLDEIIAFSGCEKYIDTPVKRYSSGMTVRLGFAVAAHLEPEILVVDEVLAVGDLEFQRKAIGKMQDLSAGEGRTVLFVSHNMGSIKSITSRAILLENGGIIEDGPTNDVISTYSRSTFSQIKKFDFDAHQRKNKPVSFENISFFDHKGNDLGVLVSGDKIRIKFSLFNSTKKTFTNCSIGIGIFTIDDNLLIALKSDVMGLLYDLEPGSNNIICQIDRLPLSEGLYKYNLIVNDKKDTLDWIKNVGLIEVVGGLFFPHGKTPASKSQTVLIDHNWIK